MPLLFYWVCKLTCHCEERLRDVAISPTTFSRGEGGRAQARSEVECGRKCWILIDV